MWTVKCRSEGFVGMPDDLILPSCCFWQKRHCFWRSRCGWTKGRTIDKLDPWSITYAVELMKTVLGGWKCRRCKSWVFVYDNCFGSSLEREREKQKRFFYDSLIIISSPQTVHHLIKHIIQMSKLHSLTIFQATIKGHKLFQRKKL